MKSYIYAAFGVIFLTLLMGFILPEGKLKKTLTFVMRIVCISVLISPVTQLFQLSPSKEAADFDFEYICNAYSDNQSIALENMIYDELGYECDCCVAFIYEDGEIREDGVTVSGQFTEQTKQKIVEYLSGLGYIHINVDEEPD